jgi:GT2 family glycosyltransferase
VAVSVVIPTWNGRTMLDVALESLERQSLAPLEVIVVDNGSTDGTAEHVRERWPEVDIVALAENVGFAAGVNRGLERVRGEFVALINNDVELHPDCLEELAGGLTRDSGAASAASKMLRFDDRTVIDATGDTMRWSGVALQRGQGERDHGQYDRAERVFSACAGAALYRRAAFAEVGPFDEGFFAYLEDVDWGFRAQLLGHGCAYVPTAIAYHVGSASTRREGKPDPFFYGLPRRNNVWMCSRTTRWARSCAMRRCCSSTTQASPTSPSATAWRAPTGRRYSMQCVGCRGCCANDARSRRHGGPGGASSSL